MSSLSSLSPCCFFNKYSLKFRCIQAESEATFARLGLPYDRGGDARHLA